jgi:hypothetical protein
MFSHIHAGAPFESQQPYNANDGNNCRAITRYITGATGFAYVPKDRDSLAKSVFVNPTVIAVDASRWNTFAAGELLPCLLLHGCLLPPPMRQVWSLLNVCYQRCSRLPGN